MYAHDVFLRFHTPCFPHFSLSFTPFSFAFSCSFHMLGLIGINRVALRKFNGKPNIFGSKF